MVNVPAPATDWPAILTGALIGVLGALQGSAVGAWIAIGHSRSVRRDDQDRHLKERTAALISRLDDAYRAVDDYYEDPSTGRNDVTADGGKADVKVRVLPTTHQQRAEESLADASAVLGYLALIATDEVVHAAKRAATKARELFDFVSKTDFLESQYRIRESAFHAARSDVSFLVAPERPSTARRRFQFRRPWGWK